MMSVKISEKNREAFSALRKKSINTRLTEQYPKRLQTVHSKAAEKEKVQTVYKFITLLEELVDEIDTTNIRS